MRGRYLAERSHFTRAEWQASLDAFQQAVDLDPRFAAAWAELSKGHARLHYLRQDLSPERVLLARQALERADTLAPEARETRLARGYCAFWCERNGAAAEELSITCVFMHRYDDARTYANQAIALTPDGVWPYLVKAITEWFWRGPTPEARAALESVPQQHEWWPLMWFWQDLMEGRARDALQVLERLLALNACTSPARLRFYPLFVPLAGDSRFEELRAQGK